MVGERVKNLVDREPVFRRLENRVDGPAHRIRQKPGEMLSKRVPRFEDRNIGSGVTTGMINAGIAVVLEDTVGVPFGATSDTISVEPASDGTGSEYIVNVNAPSRNIAKARAFIDAGTGFTSALTDTLDVRDVEVLNTRVIRDTYQVRVRVED